MTSTSYPSTYADWRGVFIAHLTDALARHPGVLLSVWCPPGEMSGNVVQTMSDSDRTWLAALMEGGGIAHQMRKGGFRGKLRMVGLLARLRRMYRAQADVDIRHVNWLQNALPLPNDGKPLLTTVLGSDMKLLALPGMVPLLRHKFRKRPTMISPNAEWMVPQLWRHFGSVAEVRYVPFGIDCGWYAVDRSAATMGHWLCVSRVTRTKIGNLFEWFEPMALQHGMRLTLIGPMQEQMLLPDWVDYRGPASSADLMRDWFPRVGGLITLSQHAEGRPQVMLEAMAAAVPIVASDIPAHADLLHDGVSGMLCRDQAQMAVAVHRLSEPDYNTRIGTSARQWAGSQVGTWDDCAERYAVLYKHLLGPGDV